MRTGHLMLRAVLVLLATFVFPHFSADAQAPVVESGEVTIERSARFIVEARSVDERYQIDVREVGTSRAPLRPRQKLPVIYVLDGNTQFQIVGPLADVLAASRLSGMGPGIPQALMVSIGYAPDPAMSVAANLENITMNRRHRDYTPVLDPEWLALNPDLPPHSGAPDFLAFIDTELKPFIASRYPVDPNDQTIVGHSMGGLFVLYALLHSPTSFDRYVAGSPGLAWGEYRPLGENARFDGGGRVSPAAVYVSAGSLEEADMIETATAMSEALKDSSNTNVTFEVIPGENHVSVIPAAMMRGLRTVFAE